MKTELPKFPHFLTIIFIICLSLFLPFQLLYSQDSFLPAQVQDISDRAYEPAVIKLLDGAKESIVLSMYNISLGAKKRNPIRFLLEDLLEARKRSVKVILYLNTRFRDIAEEPHNLIKNPFFKKLLDAGCAIHLMPPISRLHDKLIIVDGRYVVEGSTNWSLSALKENFESATLIDSPELAQIKLLRLKMLPLTFPSLTKQPHRAVYLEELPDSLNLPKVLLLDRKYFPHMLTTHNNRCMDLYLLLLMHSQTLGKQDFFIDIEGMALSLGMPASWTDSSLRRQVIRSLKELSKHYHLIRVKFFHGKDAWVELIGLSDKDFTITSKLIKADSEKKLSMRLKFLLMVKALLKSQEEDIHTISKRELAKRFHVHYWTIIEAFKEFTENFF